MSERSGGPGWWQATDGKWYPPRWEYLAERHDLYVSNSDKAISAWNELGRQGWEAVGLAPGKTGMVIMFKRPLV